MTVPDEECVCRDAVCVRECEVCAEFGSCVPAFMARDGPGEKDRRREQYGRRNGSQTR